MARRRSHLSRSTPNAIRMKYRRSIEDNEQRQNRLLKARLRKMKKLKDSDVDPLTNDVDDQQLNREMTAANVEDKSGKEGLNRKTRNEKSKQNNKKPDENDVSKIIGEAGSVDENCSNKAEDKIDFIEMN